MKGMSGRTCYQLIRLSIGVLLTIAVPAGLVLGAGCLGSNSGMETGMTNENNRIAIQVTNTANVMDSGNYASDIDNHEALYNDNIRWWIFIVLIVLGFYILAVGFMLYLSDQKKRSG